MLRIAKRAECSFKYRLSVRLVAIFAALIFSGLLFLTSNYNPIDVFSSMLNGALGNQISIAATIRKAIPLIICALGISVAFRMKFWNIGAEGQIIVGAIFATFIVRLIPTANAWILIPTMVFASMLGGGIWAAIPGAFRAQFNTNETIFTLMMNYIALQWVIWLQYVVWKSKSSLGFPKIDNFPFNAKLPHVGGVHIGWIFAVILVIAAYIFIKHCRKGFEICVIGESENTARYAAINVKKTIIQTTFISGALCGLVGMIQASAVSGTLSKEIAGGVGYTSIIVAWLAGLSAPAILVVGFLFAVMQQGGSYIESAFNIPAATVEILQATILFFVLGSEFFINYKIKRVKE